MRNSLGQRDTKAARIVLSGWGAGPAHERVDCSLVGASDPRSACRGDCGLLGDAKEIAATNTLFRAAKS